VDWFRTAGLQGVEISQHNSNSWRGAGIAPGGEAADRVNLRAMSAQSAGA